MKRYGQLDVKQKKRAVDYMFKRLLGKEIFRDPRIEKPFYIQKRLKEIQEEIKFCGCIDCFNKYADLASKDSQVKEWTLTKAIDTAELAYYPEESDTIIKVS